MQASYKSFALDLTCYERVFAGARRDCCLNSPRAPEHTGGQSPHVTLHHIERPPAGDAVGALVFFHGYSGDPAELVAFLNDIDPERRFHGYLPRAPHPGKGGRTS